MKTSRAEGVTHSESESGRELVYADEFKRLIHENPGAISSFMKFDESIKEKLHEIFNVYVGEILEDENVKLTIIDRLGRAPGCGLVDSCYYKAEIGGESFFVKSIPGHRYIPKESGGVEEASALARLKTLLEATQTTPGYDGSNFINVEVADFQLGYNDKKGHTYFVSKWNGGTNLETYLSKSKIRGGLGDDSEHMRLARRVYQIKHLLERNEFLDVDPHNMLYDPDTDKITIFDVHYINSEAK